MTAQYNSQTGYLSSICNSSLTIIRADLTKEDDVANLFREAHDQFGSVAIVVINHGIWPTQDVAVVDMSLERWQKTIDTNLTSSFLVARQYLRGLKEASEECKAKASIVTIGSTAGKVGEAYHADYASSKSALMYGFLLSLKNEIVKIAPLGRANCVAPGWTKTPMAEAALADFNVIYQALATTPLKKVAEPRDVANQVAIISSNQVSGHVTGEVLMIAGGMEGRLLNRPEDLA